MDGFRIARKRSQAHSQSGLHPEVSERAEIQEVEGSHAVKVVFRGLREAFPQPDRT
jgi:hypothetical protein